MRFPPVEPPCIDAYLLSFDDRSTTKHFGAIEPESKIFDFFPPKPIGTNRHAVFGNEPISKRFSPNYVP